MKRKLFSLMYGFLLHAGAIFLCCSLLLVGCAPTATNFNYYLLEPEQDISAQHSIGENRIIGVGPVTLPAWLDRQEIVTRGEAHELVLHDKARWGSSLKENISMVIVENLGQILDSDAVTPYPGRHPVPFTDQVVIDIRRLDGDIDKNIHLSAQWQWYKKGRLIKLGHKQVVLKTDDTNINQLVRLQSQALYQLSQSIAEALASNK